MTPAGIAAPTFSPVELIKADTDPSSNLGQLIQEFPTLQFTKTVPDHLAGVVIGSCSDKIVDERRELGCECNVSGVSCRHVRPPFPADLWDGRLTFGYGKA